jgi:hypothetical protein
MDLEQILREDEEDNDEVELDSPKSQHGFGALRWNEQTPLGDGSNSHILSQNSFGRPSQNAEDWALLQVILDEGDDDEISTEDDWLHTSGSGRVSCPTTDRANVNSIMQSDETSMNSGDESNVSMTLPSSISSTPRMDLPSNESLLVKKSQRDFPEPVDRVSGHAALQPLPATDLLEHSSRSTARRGISGAQPSALPQPDSTEDQEEEEASRRALEHARAYEQKLLRAGHREIISPLMVKRRLKPKIELCSRSARKNRPQLTERFASTSTPRFNFSGIVEEKEMLLIGASLVQHTTAGSDENYGLPTCLAFNSRFIAIGTQLGIVLVYDFFEVLRQQLGGGGSEDNWNAQKAGAVTSLDLSTNGDMIISGYTSGCVVLWDAIKGTVLRSIHDIHPSPITTVRFVANLKAVTVDAGGLVNKVAFVKNILWSTYSTDIDCLLDGTAGQILSMNVLPPYAMVNPQLRPENLASVLRGMNLIAVSSERSSFVVAVDPTVNVLHRWARPPQEDLNESKVDDHEREVHAHMPCLAWGWALTSGGGNLVMPVLARGWGCCLQLLGVSFPTGDDTTNVEKGKNAPIHWPAFGLHDEIDAKAPILALEWLSSRSVLYLTLSNELHLIDTVMMTLLERIDVSNLRTVYAEFSLSRNASQKGDRITSRDNDLEVSVTFQNSVRCSDDRLMILCQEQLKCISIVGARRRISCLEADGEWLEALALTLDHYESTVISQEDRQRNPNQAKDFASRRNFVFTKGEDHEWIAKLLMRYLNLAVENAPDSSANQPWSPGSIDARIDLAQSHFQMLAGVCVDFCVVTRRLDLLFGPIFRRFQHVGYTDIFLDVLEPYVLNDRLTYIAPEVMNHFVEYCRSHNGIATVERCLLHMDCTAMDFDTIISLLMVNEMFTALFFVFNQGLNDFVTPLQMLLEKLFEEADTGKALLSRRRNGTPQNRFERYGYKAILYLQTCFRGKTFPVEESIVPDERRGSLKRELLELLMRKDYKASPHSMHSGENNVVIGQRSQPYPYMKIFLQVDPRAALDSLSLAFGYAEHLLTVRPLPWDNTVGITGHCCSEKLQAVMDALAHITLPQFSDFTDNVPLVRPQSAMKIFLDFVSVYMIAGSVQMDNEITFMVLSRMCDKYVEANDAVHRQRAQKDVMDLLGALPSEAYDPDRVLLLIDNSGIHRAALLLHQQVASSWKPDALDLQLRCLHFQSAIDCYLEDEDFEFRKDVFAYVKKECSGSLNSSRTPEEEDPITLRNALRTKLSDLIRLDATLTVQLVVELFSDEFDSVVSSLEGVGEAQFLLLHTIISGNLSDSDPAACSVLNLTVEHHHMYLKLMASVHPELVYEYLSTHDSYRTADALKLCQDCNIADASAYLLERMGNVSSALQLILQTLESRMMGLKRAIRGMGGDAFRNRSVSASAFGKSGRSSSFETLMTQRKDTESVKRILIVALDVCERNSGTAISRSEHGSQLWFNVLDRLINAKGFLRLSREQPEHACVMAGVLSDLLRVTMQRMVSSVPLSDLVRKVTSDSSGSQLGELREMLDILLGTYSFELDLFKSATRVGRFDIIRIERERNHLQQQGSAVDSVTNIVLEQQSAAELTSLFHNTERRDGLLNIHSNGHSNFMDGSLLPYSQRAASGLGSALTKLRSRRGNFDTSKSSRLPNISMIRSTERNVSNGRFEQVSYGERLVGLLGEPEHRGRLISFENKESRFKL